MTSHRDCKFLHLCKLDFLWKLALPYCLISCLSNLLAFANDAPPQWLQQAVSANLPPYSKNVAAVVLIDDQRVVLDEGGRMITSSRYAVRLLLREGRGAAIAKEIYTTDTGRIRDFQAWLIRPSGQVKRYGKDQTLDVALVNNDIYNEVRVKVIAAGDDADIGAVFGYEAVSEDRIFLTQSEWVFQHRWPTLLSRYTLTLPQGWRAGSVSFNHAKIEPEVNGTTYSWQLQNLPYLEDEPASPPLTSLAPRLAVSYFPPPELRTAAQSFATWSAVSSWVNRLNEPQASLSDAILSKVRELTVTSKTELERIRAIGRYVQRLNYVSIQVGLGHGGGYRPHSAVDVFSKAYGDCKDKANLMRSMLKALGIVAYPVLIYSGDSSYVRSEEHTS